MEKKYTQTIFKQLGDDVMPIVGFYGPPDASEYEGVEYPSLKTDAIFKQIQEGGYNVTFQMNDQIEKKPEIVKQTMDFCEKYGILYMLCTDEMYITTSWKRDDDEALEQARALLKPERFASYLAPFIHHKACAGLYLWDEPTKVALPYGGELLDTYKQALKLLNAEDKTYYVNLLPVLPGYSGANYEEYKDYLRKAVDEMKLEYISFDSYPFRYPEYIMRYIPEVKSGISPGIFNHLLMVREIALEKEVPFWAFVQMGGNWTEEVDNVNVRRPRPTEVLWEVNLFLAFGAKGIQYFTMHNPVSYFKYLKNKGETGAFLPDGSHSDLYEPAQKANKQALACDEVLMHSVNEKILVHGEMPTIIEYPNTVVAYETGYKEIVKIEGAPTLVGCFDYLGKSVFYVMHNSVGEESGKIYITLDKTHSLRLLDRKRDEKTTAKTLEFCLDAGEATLVVIEDER